MTSGSKYVIDIAVLCDSGKVKSAMKCPCPSCIFSDLLAYGAGGGCYRNTDGWLAASWLVIQCERAELARHVRDADQANAPCVSKVPTALPCRYRFGTAGYYNDPTTCTGPLVNGSVLCMHKWPDQWTTYNNIDANRSGSACPMVVRRARGAAPSSSSASSFVVHLRQIVQSLQQQLMNLKQFVITVFIFHAL